MAVSLVVAVVAVLVDVAAEVMAEAVFVDVAAVDVAETVLVVDWAVLIEEMVVVVVTGGKVAFKSEIKDVHNDGNNVPHS